MLAMAMLAATSVAFMTATAASALEPESPPAATPASYQESGDDGTDIVEVATWTIVGVVVGALVMGALYFFKREMGGFPANPTWVAPISIERSETFADEGDFGDVAPDAHGAHH
jgi:hypothetical protein